MTTMLTLHDPRTAREHYLSGVWQHDTLYTLLARHAEARPDAIAVRDPQRSLTWRALQQEVDATAAALHRAGVQTGERVAIWLSNRVECVVIFLACSRNGYICCPSLHQNYTVGEVVTLLKRIRCAALFTEPGYGADAAQHAILDRLADIPTLRQVYALPRPGAAHAVQASDAPAASQAPSGAQATQDMDAWAVMPAGPSVAAEARAVDTNADKIVYLAFTSGTTGDPKGVMHSDNTLLANGRALVTDWRHDHATVLLTLSPLSHHIGTVALEQMLVAGMTLVVHAPAAGVSALDVILQSGATYVMGVPTHAMDILDAVRQRQLAQLGAVRCFYMAGSAIPQEVAERFVALGVTPQNVYGMTENGSHQYTLPDDPGATIVGTCGRACTGYEIRIWDAEHPDIEVPAGEIGEIGGRGGVLMLGYYDDQIATESSFNRHGWFMSGDLGRLDENGCLQILARKKDLIIRGGHNIHPSRIEDLAHRHAGVARAAAFAVADARLGEKVCLALIARSDAQLDADAVLAHLAEQGLSRFDMPEYFLVMPAFPLTASGKILKRELRAWVDSGRIHPQAVRYVATARTELKGMAT